MYDLLSLLAHIKVESALLPWVLGSLLTYALATNALWLAKAKGLQPPPYDNWLAECGRFLFYLGIPYLALGGWPRRPFKGLLSLADVGLVGFGGVWPATRWLGAVGTALGLGLITLLLLLLAWINARALGEDAQLRFPTQPWWIILVDVLYLEVHWAFYRTALGIALDDPYAGVFLGMALVYLEWSLNPGWRAGWRCESRLAGQWLRAALVLVIGLLFLLTRNLWVCLGVHGSHELALRRLGRDRVVTRIAAPTSGSAEPSPPEGDGASA